MEVIRHNVRDEVDYIVNIIAYHHKNCTNVFDNKPPYNEVIDRVNAFATPNGKEKAIIQNKSKWNRRNKMFDRLIRRFIEWEKYGQVSRFNSMVFSAIKYLHPLTLRQSLEVHGLQSLATAIYIQT